MSKGAAGLLGLLFSSAAKASHLNQIASLEIKIHIPIRQDFKSFSANAKQNGKSEQFHLYISNQIQAGKVVRLERIVTAKFVEYRIVCSSSASLAEVRSEMDQSGFLKV